MKAEVISIQPTNVWKHFYNLTQIPRPSGHEQEVIEYIRKFAEKNELKYHVDGVGNIYVQKEALPDRKTAKGLALQSHVDMVPQKNKDKIHDFLRDPIEPLLDGEWLRANQTTLGADNGIGVAAILAVLESKNIAHGPVEALFTVSEETGMDGAFGLEPELLKSSVLLNLDSEDEGELFVGCAGGIDANVYWSYKTERTDGEKYYQIEIKGLKGGHSGIDIDLGRANSNMLMAGLLLELANTINIKLIQLSGGNLRNAIPRESVAVVAVSAENENALFDKVQEFDRLVRHEYSKTEDSIVVEVGKSNSQGTAMKQEDMNRLLQTMNACPNGVIKMSESFKGKVQTSTNFSIANIENGIAEFKFLLRSSDDSSKRELGSRMENLFASINARTEFSGEYPGWDPNPGSYILSVARKCYHQRFGAEPKVNVIHAGLECGIIGGKYPKLDMISFGPTIRHPHSPDERVSIPTVIKFWDFLVDILESV